MSQPAPALANLRTWRLLLAVVIVAGLYFMREIILPVAVAGLFTFILAPIVTKLERRIGRALAVLLPIAIVAALFGLFAWASAAQIVDIARKLPTYKPNLVARVAALNPSESGPFAGVSHMLDEVENEMATGADKPLSAGRLPPVPVEVVERGKQTGKLLASLERIGEPLGSAGLVVILAIFMLFKRDDLRDRVVGLIGRGRIGETSAAMRDAAKRVNRFLLMNLLTNASYGVPIGLGLYFIGLPSAALWGALAIVLRFVPYVGTLLGMALPFALSLAVFPGWTGPLLTIGLFVVLELIVAYVVEPWLYGTSTGVSALALIVAALFWTWLWGPIGLVLSTPLTVCLLVMGQKVPQLAFLRTVLSEEGALRPHEKCYHRLLAGDRQALTGIVDEELKAQLLAYVCGGTLLPALALVEDDFQRRAFDVEQHDAAITAMRELVDELGAKMDLTEEGSTEPASNPAHSLGLKVLCIPAETSADEVAAAMLAQAARAQGFNGETLSSKLSLNEIRFAVAERKADWIWISAVNPVGLARCRHVFQEVRRERGETRISIGIWHAQEHLRDAFAGLRRIGAEDVLQSFDDALLRLEGARESFGKSFTAPAIPDNEVERLAALVELGLLNREKDELFDRTTTELTKVFDVPIAFVSLIDNGRQHFASQCGLPGALAEEGTSREVSVCGHVVAANGPLVVEDLARDPRFAGNPLLREQKLRFYAGVPLRASNGLPIGSLCILDLKPRKVSDREIRLLQMIGDNLMLEVEARAAKASAEVERS